MLEDWTPRFIAQFAAPHAQRLTLPRDGGIDHVLIDVDTQTWACLFQDSDERWMVRQAGHTRLWDSITDQIMAWRAAGEPAADRLRLHVDPGRQCLTWD
ncbi:hypothetical protein [Streptomyces flaveus]|uniref:Uncharacterized protein n=1 Tax=Streptomyces flaveus TaxID=66370 RepID=A0A917VD45_9ACTN|nr:hypothetical protein [Streptomyces flaveus]GGK62826.1 hypothetical protein GCM10010094_24510 [Streptomyces flaveus]